MSPDLLQVKELRDQLLSKLPSLNEQIREIEGQVSGLNMAIEIMESHRPKVEGFKRGRPSKSIIIEVLEHKGMEGASVIDVLEDAAHRGNELKRDSTSSQLSRLKSDGIVEYDNGKYYLTKFRPKHPPVYDTNRPQVVAYSESDDLV